MWIQIGNGKNVSKPVSFSYRSVSLRLGKDKHLDELQ